jgi:hypothetical protein
MIEADRPPGSLPAARRESPRSHRWICPSGKVSESIPQDYSIGAHRTAKSPTRSEQASRPGRYVCEREEASHRRRADAGHDLESDGSTPPRYAASSLHAIKHPEQCAAVKTTGLSPSLASRTYFPRALAMFGTRRIHNIAGCRSAEHDSSSNLWAGQSHIRFGR